MRGSCLGVFANGHECGILYLFRQYLMLSSLLDPVVSSVQYWSHRSMAWALLSVEGDAGPVVAARGDFSLGQQIAEEQWLAQITEGRRQPGFGRSLWEQNVAWWGFEGGWVIQRELILPVCKLTIHGSWSLNWKLNYKKKISLNTEFGQRFLEYKTNEKLDYSKAVLNFVFQKPERMKEKKPTRGRK